MDAQRPLEGKLVVLACSELKLPALIELLRPAGADVVVFPAIRIQALDDTPAAEKAIAGLASYDLLIFTSAHAVLHFARLLEASATELPPRLRICAIGPATAEAARAARFPVHLVPEHYVAEGIIELLSRGGSAAGLRILLPRAREARDALPDALRQAGAHVDVVPVYENVAGTVPEETLETIRRGKPDLLVFTSSSAVSNFVSLLGEEGGRRALAGIAVAALGPVTGRTVESYGTRPAIVPPENTITSLVESIVGHFSQGSNGSAGHRNQDR